MARYVKEEQKIIKENIRERKSAKKKRLEHTRTKKNKYELKVENNINNRRIINE